VKLKTSNSVHKLITSSTKVQGRRKVVKSEEARNSQSLKSSMPGGPRRGVGFLGRGQLSPLPTSYGRALV